MRTARGLLVILAVAIACGRPVDERTLDPAARRSTPSGEVAGFTGRHGSFVWMGLPYAKPPIGDRRWRAPEPPAPWTGVRHALRPGSPCMQYASPLGGIQTARPNTPVGDEDCLYLNVYAPHAATPTSFLPVMVWIHGGGNTIGAGELYDGGALAATRDVVVVTLNYRLGPFGWFRNVALREDADSDAERSGNFATLDLVRALDWVQSHVAAFGGDPARVTIFGESAGGTNVLSLLLSPQAVGLFHRAIVQSGGLRMSDPVAAEAFADDPTPETANSSNEVIARLFVADGTARDRADAKTTLGAFPHGALAERLRHQTASDVLRAYPPMPGIGMIRMPTVFRDDTVLPSGSYLDELRRDTGWNRVPVMLGTNRDENKLFLFSSPIWVRRWFGFLPRSIEPELYDVVAEHLARTWKATGADELATAMTASGARDVFVYRFDWDEEPTILGTDLHRMLGASHGFEIPFVFGHWDLGREAARLFTTANEPGRRALSGAMMDYWTTFAKTGRPGNGGGTLDWPAWSERPEYLVLATPERGGITRSSETITREAALAAVERDPRLADPRARCIVDHELVAWAGLLPRATYDAACPTFPFDGYPWRN